MGLGRLCLAIGFEFRAGGVPPGGLCVGPSAPTRIEEWGRHGFFPPLTNCFCDKLFPSADT